MRQYVAVTLLAGSLGLAGCDLDVTNPNAPTQQTVVTSAEGLIALGVGLQARMGSAAGALIYGAGLVTDELAAIGTAFSTISDAEGGTVPPNAGFVAAIWSSEYATVKTANDIIANTRTVVLPRGTQSGLLGLAYLAKAEALGELTQTFKQVAINTYNTATPSFVDRRTALTYILALLDSAERAYTDTVPSTQFTTQVLATGFDIPNTILAYKARYRRLLATSSSDWQTVVAVADSVNRAVFSTIPFSAQFQNPVFVNSTGSSGVLPRAAFRLSDPIEVKRTTYFVTPSNIPGRTTGMLLDLWNVYSTATAPIPAYYPDEVLLIKAEALVNLGQLTQARAVVDSVRTDCPGAGKATNDPAPCEGPYSGPITAPDLLNEIYRNRRYELFATGLRWEDLRRLGQVGANSIAKRCWLPYPIGERNANPANVPPDPEGTEPVVNPGPCLSIP
jgi:hypothetical protein